MAHKSTAITLECTACVTWILPRGDAQKGTNANQEVVSFNVAPVFLIAMLNDETALLHPQLSNKNNMNVAQLGVQASIELLETIIMIVSLLLGLCTELLIPRYTAVGINRIPTELDRSVSLGMLYRHSFQFRAIPS
eukprot:1620-Heterococcus_DN1.PRE.2